MHLAWQQQVNTPSEAKAIQLYGGAGYSANGATPIDNPDESVPFHQSAKWQVNGQVKVSVNRYFNLHFNLTFSEPLQLIQSLDSKNYFSNIQTPYITFQLNQNRRTRSNELNYIDYPLYGLLFEVKKIPSRSNA